MKPKSVKPIRFGDQIEIEIDSMAFGGDAVGRYMDFAVFVKGALPGERVRAKAVLVKDHYAVAETIAVLRSSLDRVVPPCPIFEECGGCQWQHFDYSSQLRTKTQFVKDAFERIGKLRDITLFPCIASPSPYGYRNKALPVLSMRDGHFVSGIYEPRSHQLVPYETCPIQGDLINALIRLVLEKIDQAGLTPYQEKSHTGFLRHLGVRQGFKTGELLLAFVTRTEVPEEKVQKEGLPEEELRDILPRIAHELMAEMPGLVGVLQNINSSRTNIVFGSQTKVLTGRDHYFEVIDGFSLKVSLQSFLQVNIGQADQLHQVVRKALGDPLHKHKWGTVLDLYSGIGTLALAVSDKADYVIGIEEIAPAVEDAKLNAKNNHRSHLDFTFGEVSEVLLNLKNEGLVHIDAAILDPPRKGVSPEVLARVTALHPERLVYVSCDPSTLARDLALLCQHGYNVEWAQPLDMFPQTYHVETVVKLTRDTPLSMDVMPKHSEGKPFRLPKEPVSSEMSDQILSSKFNLWETIRPITDKFLGRLAVSSRFIAERCGTLQKKLEAKLKERADKKAYEQALKNETLSQEQLLANAVRLEDLELQLQGSQKEIVQTPEPEAKVEPATSLVVPKVNLYREPIPQKRAPFIQFRIERKAVEWALIVAFLLVGGYIAKATLAPLLNATPVNINNTQLLPDMVATLPSRSFLRYEMVPFEVKLNSSPSMDFSEVHGSVAIYNNGEPVTTVGGRDKWILQKDSKNLRLYGNWPIPYNPKPGTYVAELTVTSPEWKSPKVLHSDFTIPALKPEGLSGGYATLTMEGGKQLINGTVPAVDGSDSMNTNNAIQWAHYMGANCYCFLAGQTSIWEHFKSEDFPFSQGDMDLADKYGREAHAAGMKFAAYITTFKVVGDAWNQAPYQFSTGYDKDTDQVVQTRFVSLNDTKRRQDIIDLLKKYNDDSNIDIIGMDYVRTGFAGYEFVDEFMKDLNVPAPEGYGSMAKEDRIRWLARTVELDKNEEVTSLFEWWRAHKVALALKSILDEAKLTKPVFTFTLGWQQGHQHGQDPAMFVDAGVNYNHIMLYEGDRNTLKSMNEHWPNYLSRCNGMYAMGEMVDFNWVQKSLNPPAPEELYNREVETFQNWFRVNARLGMFWHDLYRIIYGIRGPYSSMEWLIAGGKAFTTLKNAEGVLPFKVNLTAPREASAGEAVPISVEVHNLSNEDLRGLVLRQLDTSKDYASNLTTVGPFDLPAGHIMKFKDLSVTIPKDDEPERDNRYMAAVMVEQPSADQRAFDFTYMHRLGARIYRSSESGSREASPDKEVKKEEAVPTSDETPSSVSPTPSPAGGNIGDSLAPPGKDTP